MPEAEPAPSPTEIMRQVLLAPTNATERALMEPPAVAALQAQLPRYEVLEMLGRGGMGAVYLARQPGLDRMVAVKVLPAGLQVDDPSFGERFKNEARALARLSHPGIVNVHDSGETEDGLLYFVMEYIQGTDVQKMISQHGRLRTEWALSIAAHVCDALAYAHERGVIHRDIKPSNIMVGCDGRVKVADFGLARISQGGHAPEPAGREAAIGTPHYIAPETLSGAVVDHRADIYAVGVMLCHMLTGSPPKGALELPSLQVPGLDPRYDAIIAKAMREDPGLRYASTAELRMDLDKIVTRPVARAEAGPNADSSLLPKDARPNRSGGLRTAAPASAPEQKTARHAWGWASVVLLLAACAWAGWWFFEKQPPAAMPPFVENQVPVAPEPPAADVPKPVFTNSLGMSFVPLPGTSTLMCVHETRHRDYAAYAREMPVDMRWSVTTRDGVPIGHEPDHPVVNMSWNGAKGFCAWLSQKEGRLYRLPTDHEWSIAIGIAHKEDRAATPEQKSMMFLGEYPWGLDWPPPEGYANLNDEAHHKVFRQYTIAGYRDGFPGTAPVMSFPPNALGLYDLTGNVWEFCEEWYNYDQSARVLRGAHFNDHKSKYLRSSYRSSRAPHEFWSCDGFRVVTVPGAAVPAVPEADLRPRRPPPTPLTHEHGHLLGRWRRTEPTLPGSEVFIDFLPDGRAWFSTSTGTRMGCTWEASGRAVTLRSLNGSRHDLWLPEPASPDATTGTCLDENASRFSVRLERDLREDGPDAGWTRLFQNSLDGWGGDTAGYTVEKGVITSSASATDLISPQEYGSFHLKFDLRLSPGANSGIGIWCSDQKGAHPHLGHTGFEVQLIDDEHPTFTRGSPWQLHGALCYFLPPTARAMGQAGSWNSHEIRLEGTRLMVIINSVTVLNEELPRGLPVADASRRHAIDFSRRRGRLVLMGMKGPVDFRDMRIRELPAK